MITIKTKLNVKRAAHGRKRLTSTDDESPAAKRKPRGKTPRISKLMALAIQFEQMIRNGEATDMTELAHRGRISQPRMSQIMSLNMLAPDIQEALLHLPLETKGKPFIHEKRLRPITAMIDWSAQRRAWRQLLDEKPDTGADAAE